MINNYKDLPLSSYLSICEIYADEEAQEIDKKVAIISILSGIREEDILQLPIMEFQKMASESSFLDLPIPSDKGAVKKVYGIAGMECEPMKDVFDITTSQYVDFQMLSKDTINNIPSILSIFLIPKGHKYNDGYDINAIKDAIENDLSIIDINELLAFFLHGFMKLISASLTYSTWRTKHLKDNQKKQKMKTQIRDLQTLLRQSGDGFRMLMQFRRPADAVGMMFGK